MNNDRIFSRWPKLLFAVSMLTLPGLGGCLRKPEPEPAPPPVKEPTTYIFKADENIPQGTPLNNPDNTAIPEFFRLSGVVSGDLIYLQGMRGNAPVGQRFLARLVGIVAPPPNTPGWQSSVQTLSNWAARGKLDVSQDPKFPYDINERPIVSVVFKGKGQDGKETNMSLNRMMVRSGYALVNLYTATSFDEVKEWIKDEAHAKVHRFGLWRNPKIFMDLQQRSPLANKPKSKKKPAAVPEATPPASGGNPTKLP